MLVFDFPWHALLIPLPLIMWLLLPPSRKATEDTIPEIIFPNVKRLAEAFNSDNQHRPKTKYWFVTLLSLLWLCLVLAVMHPKQIGELKHIDRKGYDIMLAVDISESMKAMDFAKDNNQISRLDTAKKVVGNFVRQRHGDRLGLILFGEYAYLHVPMTFDSLSLGQMLDNAAAGMAGPSTAIGDAIGIAVKELRQRPEESRVLILLTDGSDTSSNIPPIEAAKIAQQFKVRIYTIGIGNNSLVSYQDANGKIQKAQLDIDEKLLESIADTTGGQYFKAEDDIELEKIYARISELEKIELATPEYNVTTLYRYPLGMACFLFLLICLIPLYNRKAYDI